MILVIGGRSKIGSGVIEALSGRGETVRALVRPAESGGTFPEGVEVVTGDLANVDSLRAAVAGADKVFLLCGPAQAEVQLNRNAIDVAKEAGIGLLVRSSILGADSNSPATFVSHHGDCDTYLAGSGVPHVILRPNMFMENIPESTIPSIDANGNFYGNAGDARLSMVDTRDVAAVAAAVLADDGHQGRTYDVTGPEALSYQDVAGKLTTALGRDVSYVDVPDDAVRDALRGFGMDEWLAGALVDLFQEYRRSGTAGYASQVSDAVQRLTGRPPRSLDQMLAERVPATS